MNPSGEISRFVNQIISSFHRRPPVIDEVRELCISKPFITVASHSSSKSRYIWREQNCSICLEPYSIAKSRAFPFNCSHEMCLHCVSEYVKHQPGNNKDAKCVMCRAPMRKCWIDPSSQTIYCRKLGSVDGGIFVPLLNSNNKTSRIHIFTRQDTTQYKLAHGYDVPDNSQIRNHIVETSVFHHTVIRIQSWIRMMKSRKLYLQKINSVTRLQRMVRHFKCNIANTT